MVSSSTSPVLRSPPCSPRFSRSLTRRLYPTPRRVRLGRSVHHRIAACTSPERSRSPSFIASNSLYEVLGVSTEATYDEIKAAYRRLAKIFHPDAVAAAGGGGQWFIRIHAAYSTLSDPVQRADYDRKLSRRGTRSLEAYNVVVSASETMTLRTYPWRNWETDQCWVGRGSNEIALG